MKRCAIVTADLQNAAANKHAARIKAVEAFLPEHTEFLNKMRAKGIPVVHLQQIYDPNDPRKYKHTDYDKKFIEGSHEAAILDEVCQESDIIVQKHRDSGFYDNNLHDVLQAMNVEVVILTGMQSQICVQTTAADATFRGYEVLVPSDGVSATKPEDTERALDWMQKYVGTVKTQKEIYDDVLAGELIGGKHT